MICFTRSPSVVSRRVTSAALRHASHVVLRHVRMRYVAPHFLHVNIFVGTRFGAVLLFAATAQLRVQYFAFVVSVPHSAHSLFTIIEYTVSHVRSLNRVIQHAHLVQFDHGTRWEAVHCPNRTQVYAVLGLRALGETCRQQEGESSMRWKRRAGLEDLVCVEL